MSCVKAQEVRHKAQVTKHKRQGTRIKRQGTRHKRKGTDGRVKILNKAINVFIFKFSNLHVPTYCIKAILPEYFIISPLLQIISIWYTYTSGLAFFPL